VPEILTPAVLSKVPLGLLGFFQIKNGGQYPQTLGTIVGAELDLWRILAANYNENIAASVATAATGFTVATEVVAGTAATVPASELWLITAMGIVAVTGAGETATYNLMIQNTQSGGVANWHTPLTEPIAILANLTQFNRVDLASGMLWLKPGDQIGFQVQAIAGGTVDFSVSFRRTRFPF
jgi:hypothetical protein